MSSLRYGLLENHGYLIMKLDPTAVSPFLVSEGLLTLDECEVIKSKATDGERTESILTLLHRKGSADESVFKRFLNVLSDELLSGGQQLQALVKKIYEDSSNPQVVEKHQMHPGKLDPRQKAALHSLEEALVSSVIVGDILADLVSLGVLTLDENEVIRSGVTYQERAHQLIQIIYHKSSEQFVHFAETLVAHEIYSELGRKLLMGSDSNVGVTSVFGDKNGDYYVAELLKNGHVPPRHSVYVDRPEYTESIRTQLRQLKDTDGWVVVHGMAGFGKTILASEAIRDVSLLLDVFPGGVQWLHVGQMMTKDGDIDQAKLLTRLQNFIVRLDDQVSRPPNLEAASNTLQKLLSEKYPRCLLVLDDIWSPEVAQAFSVRCCTMVTSRNSAVASMVLAPKVTAIPVLSGFSEEDGKLLLARWLNTLPEQLPKEAGTIIECCRGSPMVIALIGAILKKNPHSDRKWRLIAEKLKKKHFHSIKLHAPVNEWSYQHATLNASIELSVENLPPYLQVLFEMFVVFDYNTIVSSRALEIIWDKDSLDTEELLMELVGLSLVQKAPPTDRNSEYITFVVHDIVLDYLQHHVEPQKQINYHATIVKRYSQSEGAYAYLPDDGYVYQKLIGHIAASGDYSLLGDLLSQLSWLISTTRSGNSVSLLADYRLYKSKIPQQIGVQQFEFFMSGHMDILANDPSEDEIIQQALLQPSSSEVFVQASAKVHGDRRKSWFYWSNKESDPEKYVLKLKIHKAGVKRCQYSKDGRKVVSCSTDSGVKLWDASTGMELADFRGHNDMVTCCALSNSGRFVVSTSEDNTVKVWDSRRKTSVADGSERLKGGPLLLEFKGHQYGVQCCAISPDESMVISADIDSCVMLWESLSGKIISQWRLSLSSPVDSFNSQPSFSSTYMPHRAASSSGTEGVLSCAFSPDGKKVVTGTQTGSVVLWKTDGKFICSLLGHKSQVRCCVFDGTGDGLATACSGDFSAKIWKLSSHECKYTLNHSCAVLCCDFSPDQERLVTGNTEGVVLVWSVLDGTQLEEYFLHSDHVNCVLYSPTQPHILSAADNGIVKIQWNNGFEGTLSPSSKTTNAHYHRRFSAHFYKQAGVYSALILCYNKKSKKLQLVQGSQATVIVPEIPALNGQIPRSWNLSEEGTHLVVGFQSGALQVISVLKGGLSIDCHELWHVNCAHKGAIMKTFFSPDNSKLVTCSETQHKTWCVKSGDSLAVMSGSGLGVKPVIFFKDCSRLASAQEKGVLIWCAEAGSKEMLCSGIADDEDSIVLCLNLSQNDTRLVASNSTGLVMVWCTVTGEPLLKSEVAERSPCARSCALSPNGCVAAAGFDDGSLKIWYISNLDSSKQIAHCSTNSSYWMIDVAFSPDGHRIVTLCDTIEWWSKTGKHLKTIRLKGAFGKYIRFSPDFSTFVTIDNAGLLYILDSVT